LIGSGIRCCGYGGAGGESGLCADAVGVGGAPGGDAAYLISSLEVRRYAV
jgi:hypothetical protein